MTPSFFFATPCHSNITVQYCRSALALTKELVQAGIEHEWAIHQGCSIISIARNLLVQKFLDGKCNYLFWIDSDIRFEPDDFAKIYRLDADIGVGAASTRAEKRLINMWKGGKRLASLEALSGPIEVDYAGTGFMAVKREVIEVLSQSCGAFMANDDRVPALYMTPIHDGEFEGEDHFFCRIAREAGFKIVLDPSVRVGHVGQCEYKL